MNWTYCGRSFPGKSLFCITGRTPSSWKPAGEEEVLWLSNNTPFKMASLFAVAYRFAGRGLVRLPTRSACARFCPQPAVDAEITREDADGVALTFELTQSEETKNSGRTTLRC